MVVVVVVDTVVGGLIAVVVKGDVVVGFGVPVFPVVAGLPVASLRMSVEVVKVVVLVVVGNRGVDEVPVVVVGGGVVMLPLPTPATAVEAGFWIVGSKFGEITMGEAKV